jgi:hypothetical protein
MILKGFTSKIAQTNILNQKNKKSRENTGPKYRDFLLSLKCLNLANV